MEDTSGAETPMDDFERDTLNYIRHCFNTFRNLGLSPEEAVAKLVDRPGLPLIDLTWKEAEFISFEVQSQSKILLVEVPMSL